MVKDVPNDQGRFVRVEWLGSYNDQIEGAGPIEEYSVWRKINPMLKAQTLGKVMKVNDAMWEMVNVTKAIQMKESIHKVIVLGSGALKIGEAGEFDYSGSQALRSLREDGIETVLINSNPATIMTDPEMADAIYIDQIRKHGLYDEIWQAFAVFLPIQSVGVMGDERTYENAIALRCVSSVDAMTADWSRLPAELLALVSSRITNEVQGINRVVYDISSKPPATIEWE